MNPVLSLALLGHACAADIPVATPAEFQAALYAAEAGDRILLAPGTYRGDFFARRLDGTPEAPIVIAGADPSNPPVLAPTYTGLQLSGASHVEVRDLRVAGYAHNGLNVDDDGDPGRPSHHVTLRNLHVVGTSPNSNSDGIKLSGVTDLLLTASVVEGWGRWGSGVDLVGCHRATVVGCGFRLGGFNGVQVKGGSSGVRVAGCRFDGAGERAIQVGGRTEPEFFRPRLETVPVGQRVEARDVLVDTNIVTGGLAAVAVVTAERVTVRQNTVYLPGSYFLRILQETGDPAFAPCRDCRVDNNLVVWRAANWPWGGVNVGGGTAPHTFGFAGNAWYCEDQPARSGQQLPTPEADGLVGVDPRLANPQGGNFRPLEPRMRGRGAVPYGRRL